MTVINWSSQQYHVRRFGREVGYVCAKCDITLPPNLPFDDPCDIQWECTNADCGA